METKTVVKYRNRPKAKRRKRAGFTLPIAVAVPMAALGVRTVGDVTSKGLDPAFELLSLRTTGFNPRTGQWKPGWMKEGLLPVAVGLLVHKVAGKLGANKMIARAGIPILRI